MATSVLMVTPVQVTLASLILSAAGAPLAIVKRKVNRTQANSIRLDEKDMLPPWLV